MLKGTITGTMILLAAIPLPITGLPPHAPLSSGIQRMAGSPRSSSNGRVFSLPDDEAGEQAEIQPPIRDEYRRLKNSLFLR